MSKNKGGRPEKPIDYSTLDKLCAIQCTGEECAEILEIDYDTLNKHLKKDGHGGFSEYFAKKRANGRASLRRMQYKAAESGNSTMLVWLGKQWLGQTDKHEVDNKSSDGSMSQKPSFDASKLSTEAIKELLAARVDDSSSD